MDSKRSDQGKRAILLSVSLISAVALVFAVQGGIAQMVAAPVFEVKEVEVVWPGISTEPRRFSLTNPTSVFHVNLTEIHHTMRKEYPADEIQAVQRILPNRVVATLRKREVLALLRSGRRFYPVSEDGTVVGQAQRKTAQMPVLSLRGVRGQFNIGDSIGEDSFWAASRLLRTLEDQGGLGGLGVDQVKTGKKDLFLVLNSGLEIRFTLGELWSDWKQLGELLSARPELLQEARYIDLRFQDPAIGGLESSKGKR